MKILFITNLFPPCFIGGYELACHDIEREMRRRGHKAYVLTSTYGACKDEKKSVFRILEHSLGRYPESKKPSNLAVRLKGQWFSPKNFLTTCRIIKGIRPDVVYIWCLEHVSIAPICAAAAMKRAIAYYVFDKWFTDFKERLTESASEWKLRVKRLTSEPLFETTPFDNVAFGSAFLRKIYRERGVEAQRAVVLYHGLDVRKWRVTRTERPPTGKNWRLLYVGQVAPHKGVHNLIEALRQLGENGKAKLTIVGNGRKDYIYSLRERSRNLEGWDVVFTGKLSRRDLSRVYGQNDLLVFPSIWDEPFGLVVLEGMASGLPVLVSEVGGTVEIVNGAPVKNTFARNNVRDMAESIESIMNSPQAWRELRDWGIERVKSAFSLEKTVKLTENHLTKALT